MKKKYFLMFIECLKDPHKKSPIGNNDHFFSFALDLVGKWNTSARPIEIHAAFGGVICKMRTATKQDFGVLRSFAHALMIHAAEEGMLIRGNVFVGGHQDIYTGEVMVHEEDISGRNIFGITVSMSVVDTLGKKYAKHLYDQGEIASIKFVHSDTLSIVHLLAVPWDDYAVYASIKRQVERFGKIADTQPENCDWEAMVDFHSRLIHSVDFIDTIEFQQYFSPNVYRHKFLDIAEQLQNVIWQKEPVFCLS